MKICSLAAVAAVFTLATPAAFAGPDTALDACVKSFVSSRLPKDQPVRVVKREAPLGPLSIMARPKTYVIDLVARVQSTGEELAQARCVSDVQGRVIVMEE